MLLAALSYMVCIAAAVARDGRPEDSVEVKRELGLYQNYRAEPGYNIRVCSQQHMLAVG
jgi:hypothetical protein